MPLPPLSLEPDDVEQEETSAVPEARPAQPPQQIPYEPGTQVSRRQFRFLLTLTLINTLMLGAFVAGPGISRMTGGWWRDYQNWRAARQAAQQRAAAQRAFMASYEACLANVQPADRVIYEEGPKRAKVLLKNGKDFAEIHSSNLVFFPPEPWQLPVYRLSGGVAAQIRPDSRAGPVFIHARRTADGVERLVWVRFIAEESMPKTGEDSQEMRTYRVTTQRLFMADSYGPGDDTTLKGTGTRATSVRQHFLDTSFVIWHKGPATWENGTIEPHLSQVFRVFAGQPDPRDASHFTIGYEVDGKPGTIDGWLLKDLTVVLEPREGRIVQQDVKGLRREWDPYADPPTTRPSDPSTLVPLLPKP